MLGVIKDALSEAAASSSEAPRSREKQKESRWAAIEHFLLAVPTIRNADVQQLCGVSPATANRILNEFCKEGKLERVRVGRYSSYRKPK